MPEFEHAFIDYIVVDMSGCYTLVSEPNPKLNSYDHPTQKFVPYHHPHHKN